MFSISYGSFQLRTVTYGINYDKLARGKHVQKRAKQQREARTIFKMLCGLSIFCLGSQIRKYLSSQSLISHLYTFFYPKRRLWYANYKMCCCWWRCCWKGMSCSTAWFAHHLDLSMLVNYWLGISLDVSAHFLHNQQVSFRICSYSE
jgi:hypothetical protein